MTQAAGNTAHREPWNKDEIVGSKGQFKRKDICALRVRFQMARRVREIALFNLGIFSERRGCDLVAPQLRDVCHGDQVATCAIVLQLKPQRSVHDEITSATRDALQARVKRAGLKSDVRAVLRSTILRMTPLSVFDLARIDACALHDHASRLRSGGLLAGLAA